MDKADGQHGITTPAATGYITNNQSRSSPNSLEIKWFTTTTGADMVYQYSDINSGTWVYRAWQYVPSSMTGTQYFILMNTYTPGGVHNSQDWSLQLEFSATGGYIRDYNNQAATLPLKTNKWALIRVVIDFEADLQTVYYDETFLTSKSWKNGVSPGGAKNLACVDLYAGDTASTSVYYDDLSVAPLGPPLTCDAGGPYYGNAKKPIQFSGTATGGIEPYTWLWNFGDESTSNEQNPAHEYSEPGEYNVTLIVTDAIQDIAYDYTTVYVSEVLEPDLDIGKISGGLGISALIRNFGTANATDVQWRISLSGFVFPKEKQGVIGTIIKSGQEKINTKIFGFGKITITVNATCAEGSTAEKTATGKVFTIFTFGIK
ncbi:MAG: PKD domain-containing protein [Candidatus Thermoplasmatota archaeon]|nr:PKD domain-containing protein [Candidatus Thermoplasmatota archaeon]